MAAHSLELLVKDTFDHAGIFPPTQRPLEEAWELSACFPARLSRPDIIAAEMVFQFAKLETVTLEALKGYGFSNGAAVRLSLLASESLEAPLIPGDSSLLAELIAIKSFNEERASQEISQRVVAYDLRLSPDFQTDRTAVKAAGKLIATTLSGNSALVFFEPDLSQENWQSVLSDISTLIRELNDDTSVEFGLKARGTGPTGIPTERFAGVIAAARDADIPLKLTGGFHWPFPNDPNAGENPNTLGFLNFLAAVAFARRLNLEPAIIQEILDETDSTAFRFEDDSLSWKDYRLSAADITEAKQQFFSIGCCNPLRPDSRLRELYGD